MSAAPSPGRTPLFEGTMDLADLIRYMERLADMKNIAYHSSFGISKNRAGTKQYTALFTSTSTSHQTITKNIVATSVRQLFEEVKDFLQTL